MDQATANKFVEFVKTEFAAVSAAAIIKNGNSYWLFGTYTVDKENNNWIVNKYSKRMEFVQLSTAVAWCITDKYNLRNAATQLVQLDAEQSRLQCDIATSKQLAERARNCAHRYVILVKASNKIAALRIIERQLLKYINIAKYWQIKGFVTHETARPRLAKQKS